MGADSLLQIMQIKFEPHRGHNSKHQGVASQTPMASATDPFDLDNINEGVKQAHDELKYARQHAEALRNEHLERRAALYQSLQEVGKAKIVERLQKAEELHRTNTKLSLIRNPRDTVGLSHNQVPTDPNQDPKTCSPDPTHWRRERVPEEIERLLLTRNNLHFGQAHGTPLTVPAITADIRFDGSGHAADLILDGTYEPTNIDTATHAFIQHMQRKTTKEISERITREEFLSKLRKWKESTSTSPSGIHLGHYHVLWRNHGLDPDKQAQQVYELENKRELLIRIHVGLLNYAIKFGYPLKRWTNVVNVMLLKEPGNPKIHRLRIIHLYEADYNLLLAVKWRATMHSAEDQQLLNQGLYGCRPARSAQDPVFLENLQNEIYRTSMKTGINKDLDATSCYDRIIPSIANICSRRMGTNAKVATLNSRTLEATQYRLKTSLGISTRGYQHSRDTPIYGTGQGSGNSPQIWNFICSALFDAYEAGASGADFVSYNKSQAVQLFMTGYVDDCCQRINDFSAFPQPTSATMIARMQQDAQWWHDLLWASGGALELPKCSFHLIKSRWTPSGIPFLEPNTANTILSINSSNGPIQVPQLSNYRSHKTLGHYVNPNGSMTSQLQHLIAQSTQFASWIQTNILTPSETMTMYHSIYVPSITYTLCNANLTPTECNQIDVIIHQAVLPRCGYNRNMATALRYSPQYYGGAGFRDLYTEQSVATILQALKYLRSPESQLGKMLRIALSWVQAYIGTSTFIWEDVQRHIPPCPSSWILGVRHALKRLKGSISLQANIIPPKLRENDEYIMDLATTNNVLPSKFVDQINACRRYLQATTLADISNDQGTKIESSMVTGDFTASPRTHRIELFNQQKPNPAAWRVWKKFLSTITHKDYSFRHPLRNWTAGYQNCRRNPSYVYNESTNVLYRHDGQQYTKMNTISRGRFTIPDSTAQQSSDPQGYPAYVQESGTTLILWRNYNNSLPTSIDMPEGFHTHITKLPTWERCLLETCSLACAPEQVMHELNKGTIIVASDGTVINQSAAFGYVIATATTKQRLIRGRGPAFGVDPTSFRAEAYGALAAIQMIYQLSQYTNIPVAQSINHYIDNSSVVTRINKELKSHRQNNPNATLAPEWDIIHQIQQSIITLSAPIQVQWIPGHQDAFRPREQLRLESQLNCEADDEGAAYQATNQAPRWDVPCFPTTHAHLTLHRKIKTSRYKTAIRESSTLPPLMTYLKHRFNWDTNTLRSIDWTVFRRLVTKHRHKHKILVKHLHAIAPTGHIAHRNQPHLPQSCPSCPCADETNDHIIVCLAPSRAQWRAATMAKLVRNIENTWKTDPILESILREGLLRTHQYPLPVVRCETYPSSYHNLITSQNTIGWIQLYRGRWSAEWANLHTAYTQDRQWKPELCNGTDWVSKCGDLLIEQWMNLWTIRNNERHGADEAQRRAKLTATLQQQMEHYYSQRNAVLPADKALLFPYADANSHLKSASNLEQLQEWILDNIPRTQASALQATRQHLLGTRDIRAWLTPPIVSPDRPLN